ncbi:MAG TPA: hypothetical protein VLE27_00260 [Thermoanaerobaculia bacterium]|nr:hypothetical protein [Thermoanaerobaculia bacterium]
MEMEPYFTTLCSQIVGLSVRNRRLAGNTLIVYVECSPGDKSGYVLCLEPTWHMCDSQGVVAGSRQAQEEEPEEPGEPTGFEMVADQIDNLVGKRIEQIDRDARTGDLTVQLEGGYLLRTFVCDPREERLWYIRDGQTKQTIHGDPKGLRVTARGT